MKAPAHNVVVDADDDMKRRGVILCITLEAAVPIWIHKLAALPLDRIVERAHACGDFVAEHGDVVIFQSSSREGKKFGGTAAAFNALAEGLACLAFCPGGVRFMDLRWEATHPEAWDAL